MKHEPAQAFQPAFALGERRPRIVIVGAGFTGAAAAISLLKVASRPMEILFVEPGGPIGTGLAYGRAGERHLLNVRAQRLSVVAERPSDFADWAAKALPPTGFLAANRRSLAQSFLPRRSFGTYVRRRLQDAIHAAPHVSVAHTRDLAIEVRPAPGGYSVVLRNGGPITADAVVIATGYGRGYRDRGLGGDPYAPLDADRLKPARRVVLVGTGLTMVDALVSLRDAGFKGEVAAISRRGALPLPHAPEMVPVYPEIIAFDGTAASLTAAVRRACADAAERGLPWQSVANALRPQLAIAWPGIPVEQQARLLRHASPHWNAHRHRLPPEVHEQLARERASGGLTIARARVIGVAENETDGRLTVLTRPAGKDVERLDADLVLDCSGFRADTPSTIDASLERTGIGGRNPHGLGLTVAPDGGVIDRAGVSRRDLFALGPIGHGSLIEITAVPEIVRQAEAAARTLAADLNARSAAGA